jgi:hypothetical protein
MTRPIIGRILLLPFGFLAGTLILEAALRAAGVSYPRTSQKDDNRGVAYRPHARWRQQDEGDAWVEINGAGFRDRERTLAKPARTLRIAILGDSFVDAVQVPVESTFACVLERRLNSCAAFGEQNVEVLNFGVSGYGTAQELLTLRHAVWPYEPDLVVLCFLTGNDVRDNTAALHREPGRPYFFMKDGVLELDTSFRRSYGPLKTALRRMGFGLLEASRVAQVIYRARKRSQEMRKIEFVKRRKDVLGPAPHQELGLDNMVYVEPAEPAWREGWRITEALIATMNREIRERGAESLVVTLSNSIQVNPDPRVRREFSETLGVSELFYPDDRIRDLGEREGFRVLNLARPLRAYAERHGAFVHGFSNTALGLGHWNALGHRVAGTLIAEEIARSFGSSTCSAPIE